ncbi:protein of unknown function [Acidithiobacillus ferrivorans]|uniref:Uncharacterized protein n=1 Tax=Acidithiobacillus ferrivorans TaxID=160808 RepID=A0A060UTB8_9PROT|nr:hypothetical protein AFERRI_600098 [Acidithiobacillus ferrivorans]SMH65427.1 protein of unknown function [Acidithiobacillus ferrivorans]
MGNSAGSSAFGRNNSPAWYGKKRLIKRLSEFLLLASVRIAYTELASHARSLEGGLP